ncbi:hypothetical protein [Cryptosporangium minutisporangium]|uniref:Uncharacterized protein n=1 Tax=Cryptosporangium minutisporangium TaxID=113569 RepID=A0ABP6SZ37_9ACTN
MTTARSTLLSWVREGTAVGIEARDGQDGLTNRVELTLTAEVNGVPAPDVRAHLLGPGDVVGLDPRLVVRTDPPHLGVDYEPNNFPSIEFDPPALPWLFTPASADDNGRLRPWISLVVVPQQGATVTADPQQPTPVLRVPGAELPNPREAWAWAHTEVTGVPAMPDALTTILSDAPERTVSRLICPRRLRPYTAYLACVVPTFLAGRLAGLGEPVENRGPLLPAWEPTDAEVALPVYYSWQFSTGEQEDFESLVSRLTGRRGIPGVGTRVLDLGGLGHELAGLDLGPDERRLGFEGALRVPEADRAEEADPDVAVDLRARLAQLVNAGAADGTPRLTPPLYGGIQTTATGVDPDAPGWLAELNLDPRFRAAAGLGSRAVADRQEELMAAAWTRAGDLPAVNRLHARAQLARSAAESLLARHLGPLPADALLRITASVQAGVDFGSSTVTGDLRTAGLPLALLSVPARRLLRPRGPLLRRAGLTGTPDGERLLRINRAPDAPSDAPPVMNTLDTSMLDLTSTATDSAAASFRTATTRVLDPLTALAPVPVPTIPDLALPQLRAALLLGLAPRNTVGRRVRARVRLPAGHQPAGDDLAPALAPPTFTDAIYEALKRISDDLLLPGAERIPSNTVLLLETNPRFVEAFMVGLNHEFARELRWRGYPTDLRATYFRHFWDVRGTGRAAVDGDILPIDEENWPAGSALGSHLTAQHAADQLVMVLRSDLLRRYPRTMVRAVLAAREAGAAQRTLADDSIAANVKEPVFAGSIGTDLSFFGFDLDEEEARSGGGPGEGWFVVLEQPPTESRFGLDQPDETLPEAEWVGGRPGRGADLSWGHLADSRAEYDQLTYAPAVVDRLADLPMPDRAGARWGAGSADLAVLTRQLPVRIALHADLLLPPRRAEEPRQ